MGRKFKSIMKDELNGYHSQVRKMKTTDNNAITKVNKKRRVF